MTYLFNKINYLNEELLILQRNGIFEDFRIYVRVNNKLDIYLLNCINITKVETLDLEMSWNFIETINLEDDSFLEEIFKSDQKINLGSRRSLNSLLENENNIRESYKSKIATFYSYKGGVGRSTTLASCASYLSVHCNKKIVILDCDFEAPGLINFYLDHPNEINFQNGIMEYLMDSQTESELSLNNYLFEVGVEYTGNGQIYVMNAGNLSEDVISEIKEIETHKKQYLNAMGPIQISSKLQVEQQFTALINHIDKEISPDFIFIDSRTGFNDIFGLAALLFSDLVIGFFGDSAQTNPGLEFFIEKIAFNQKEINSILVNSIIPNRSRFKHFENKLESLLVKYNDKFGKEDNLISIKSFPIVRYPSLETIGSTEDSKFEFIDLIENKRLPEYNELFDYINELLVNKHLAGNQLETIYDFDYPSNLDEDDENFEVTNHIVPNETEGSYNLKIDALTNEILSVSLKDAKTKIDELLSDEAFSVQRNIKKKIKAKLKATYPKLYGETHTIDEVETNIYYRKSMEDIFNHSKLIVLGNKGTGKTFLYEALKITSVVDKLKQRAQKKENYVFLHLIDPNKKFIDTGLFEGSDDQSENFYHRFWVVFIWNSIMLESEDKFGYKSKFEINEISNELKVRNRFLEIIKNDETFIAIETELKELDEHLKRSDAKHNLIVIFDGLDQMVKPLYWHYKIVPLISYWRHHSFNKIAPKLFLRSDLFEKLSNITNVKELKNQSISIEWTQQELFAYFFKLILQSSNDYFLVYMLFTKYNSFELIKQIKQKSGIENQIPLDDYYLRPMVEAFFGKFADAKNSPKYGESYEWFYRNLKNANNTISLRPFIDLLESAFEYANENDSTKYPVLPANYFAHGNARQMALTNHFDDLIKEKGNEDIAIVCQYIREKKNKNQVYLNNSKANFDQLLQEIIETNQTENKSIDQLINLLKLNGVILEQFTSKGITYSFALLYKYFLGLKTK